MDVALKEITYYTYFNDTRAGFPRICLVSFCLYIYSLYCAFKHCSVRWVCTASCYFGINLGNVRLYLLVERRIKLLLITNGFNFLNGDLQGLKGVLQLNSLISSP